MRLPAIAFTLVLLAAGRAAAGDGDEEVSPFVAKSTAIYIVGGPLTPVGFVGSTPVGFVGLEAEQNLTSFWSVSAGAGYGDAAPQVAAMTHLLLGSAWSKLTLGAGLSRGQYVWQGFEGDEIAAQKSGTVTWANFEIGGEHRFRNGFSMRYFGGYHRIVQGALVCEGDTAPTCLASYQNAGTTGLYTGFAFGFAF